MIALDSSAIVAILLLEAEEAAFRRAIVGSGAIVGAPTLVETRMVLESNLPANAEGRLRAFLTDNGVAIVPFDAAMFGAAIAAFARYGKGRGHPANLNFGDCLSYAVSKIRAVPLLFKGNDFVHTDLVPAYSPAP